MLTKHLPAILLGIGQLLIGVAAQAYVFDPNPGDDDNKVAVGPKTYAILVGSQAPSAGVDNAVRGDFDVDHVAAQLNWTPNVTVLKYKWDDPNTIAGDIQAAASSISSVIRPGDSFIFYYSGHGTGGSGEGVQDFLNPVAGTGFQDNSLAAVFSGSPFADVNKFFLIDSCHSEGMWKNDSAGDQDLEMLTKISFLASSSEDGVAYADVGMNGTGFFTNSILSALTPNATFGNLLASAMGSSGQVTGFFKDDGFGTGLYQPVGFTSADFDPNIPLGGTPVPEPGTVILLSMAAAAVVWRWRR